MNKFVIFGVDNLDSIIPSHYRSIRRSVNVVNVIPYFWAYEFVHSIVYFVLSASFAIRTISTALGLKVYLCDIFHFLDWCFVCIDMNRIGRSFASAGVSSLSGGIRPRPCSIVSLCEATSILQSLQIRTMATKGAPKQPLIFEEKRTRANRAKRLDRIKSALKKAADIVAEHNEKNPSNPITVNDVSLDIQTPAHKRRVEMRAALRDAIKKGDTESLPLLVTFLKQVHGTFNLNPEKKPVTELDQHTRDTLILQEQAERQAKQKETLPNSLIDAQTSPYSSSAEVPRVASSILAKKASTEPKAASPSAAAAAPGTAARVAPRVATSIKDRTRNVLMKEDVNFSKYLNKDLDEADDIRMAKQFDMHKHFLNPNLGSLGLTGGAYTDHSIVSEEMGAEGVDLESIGLAGQAGAAKSYAYNNNRESLNPRLTAIISSRKARLIQEVANSASATLMRKQLSGKGTKVEYKQHTVSKYEIAELKKQLRGRGGDAALKKLIKLKSQEVTPIGFVDLYDLGFMITRITVSSDLAHATVHWTAPCLMPLPEADLTKLNTPTGTLLEAAIKGYTSKSKYTANPAMAYVKTKDGLKPLDPFSMDNTDVSEHQLSLDKADKAGVDADAEDMDANGQETVQSNVTAEEAQSIGENTTSDMKVIRKDGKGKQFSTSQPENAHMENMSADDIYEAIDWEHSDVIFFDPATGVPMRRSPDGTVKITTVGDPKLWRKRKTFQGTYLGGTIDPIAPPDMTRVQVSRQDKEKSEETIGIVEKLAAQQSSSIATKHMMSGNKLVAHERASSVVVTLTNRYLDSVVPSLRWMLGERLQIKYVPNVRFEFDEQYGRMKNRAKSVAAALQNFYFSAEKERAREVYDENVLSGDKLVDAAARLRATASIIKKDLSADMMGDTLSAKIMTPKIDKRTRAARLINVPVEELELLTEADLDLLLSQQNMFRRMQLVEGDDARKAMMGRLDQGDVDEEEMKKEEEEYRRYMQQRKQEKEERKKRKEAMKIGRGVTGDVDVSSIMGAQSAQMVDDMMTRGIMAMGQGHGGKSGKTQYQPGQRIRVYNNFDEDEDEDDGDWSDEDEEAEEPEDVVVKIEESDDDNESEWDSEPDDNNDDEEDEDYSGDDGVEEFSGDEDEDSEWESESSEEERPAPRKITLTLKRR